MFFTKVVLLQLLWLSLASASDFYGGCTTFNSKRNTNGTYHVEIRNKATFRGCAYQHGYCYRGNCGHNSRIQAGVIDSNPNSATYAYGSWCQTESVVTKILTTDTPFETWENSCCWVSLRFTYSSSWSVWTKVDLGTRSDTNAPNNSPDIAIMPYLRVPQNCRRSYSAIFVDPEDDVVRCRYGNRYTEECAGCVQQPGFQLNEATCTLDYLASGYQGVHGFELVVEDYPRKTVVVTYSDGSTSQRHGAFARRKRWAPAAAFPTTAAFTATTAAFTTTTTPTTTAAPATTVDLTTTGAITTTTAPTTAAPTTTAAPATTVDLTTTGAITTTTAPTTAAPTTTAAPATTGDLTTTGAFTTTTAPTTAAPTTTAAPATTPTFTTTAVSTTTTAAQTTTTFAPTTTGLLWTAPFSILPLQFTFRDPPAPSCTDGLYLPKFVSPTPQHGETLVAEVDKELEIRVKAQAQYSVVDNIFMTGPLNITKHRTTGDVFTLKWTPTDENFGHYFLICFVVEFTRGSDIYQTEMRCVVVNVTDRLTNTVVTCNESSMTVEVEKATLPRIHFDQLRLSDPSNNICSLQRHSNSTHVVAIVPLNRCGTQIEEDNENLIFKNEITTEDSNSSLITRRHQLEIRFECLYVKTGNVTLTFSAHRDKVIVWDKGFGQLTYTFEFYKDQTFGTPIDPRLYPLDLNVGDMIYMGIEATSTVDNIQLFVLSCEASPYDNPSYTNTYSIIKDGCNKDSTMIVHPSPNQRQFRFSMEAFKFIGLHDQVYISCTVMMCEAGNSQTRCSKGCLSNSSRRKRESALESAFHYVSQGPLRLKRSAEVAGNTGLNLNLVFIAGCVLAALGMICGVIYFKAKKSTVKYQPLSSEEN